MNKKKDFNGRSFNLYFIKKETKRNKKKFKEFRHKQSKYNPYIYI